MVPAAGPELRTERLILRRWRAADAEPFAWMNADPRVMKHFPRALSREQSALLIAQIEACFEQRGFGLWALEPREDGGPSTRFAGFVGLWPVEESLPFGPAVEIGWRLAHPFWDQGLASEAAGTVLDFAFGALALGEIVAYTAARNGRSRRVMERLGMSTDPAEDFAHPEVPASHPLSAHVLYRLAAADWRSRPAFAAERAATPETTGVTAV
jgi:RimJ/RimL family protein N-acetyltransferase